jgi:type I site-specific restriction endonuclease
MKPEERARIQIDELLVAVGRHVCDVHQVNVQGALGVALREFPLNTGYGFGDYLLSVNGKACGPIEAKTDGAPLKGVEVQSERYAQGLPAPESERFPIVAEVDRHLSIPREVEAEVELNLQRAQVLWRSTLSKVFS